jgi:rhodanese-related sulfurtransferase
MFNRLFGKGDADDAGRVHIVSAAQVKEWMAADEVVLIDVREPGEHAAEAIPGALNLPLSSFDVGQLPAVPDGKRLVFHCRSGVRCGSAAEHALAQGYGGEIFRLEGGIFGWKAVGGTTV